MTISTLFFAAIVQVALLLLTSALPCWWLWNTYLSSTLGLPNVEFSDVVILIVATRLALHNFFKVEWKFDGIQWNRIR